MAAKGEAFLSTQQVRKRYGVSHMWIERRLADDPTFPRYTKLGRLRFFKRAELETWELVQATKTAQILKSKNKSERVRS
jgi:predicted DNA-binding transcriptional regulator AlpA